MPMKSNLPFNSYDVPISLKGATCEKMQGDQPVITYHLADATHIAKVPQKQLVSAGLCCVLTLPPTTWG